MPWMLEIFRMRPMYMASIIRTATWLLKALVLATPISGPA